MTAPTPEPDLASAAPEALVLRLVARRHVDLHRVSSALCRRTRP